MKKLKINLSPIFILVILLFGCRELRVTTKINNDGSIERIIKIRGDSTETFNNIFPVPVDSTWAKRYYKDSLDKKGKKYVFIISKKFKNIEELNNLYKNDNSSYSKLDREISLEKHNKWFYTYLIYREIYGNINSFNKFPISDYLTKEEFNSIFNSENDSIEKNNADSLQLISNAEKQLSKLQLWFNKNFFEEFYDILLNNIEKSDDKNLSPENLKNNKSKIFASVSNEEDLTIDIIINKSSEILKVDISDKIKIDEADFYELGKKTEKYIYLINGEKFKNEIILPGTIIKTNAEEIDSNILSWNIKAEKFFYDDFIMQAESKYINPSAIGLAIILGILFLLIYFFRKILRK